MTRWMPFIVLAVLGTIVGALRAEERTWTSAQGDFKVTGTFVRERDGAIDIRLSDGRLVQIQSDSLSRADRDFVAGGGRRAASPPPQPTPGRDRPLAPDPMSASDGAEEGSQVVTTEGSGLDKEAAVRDACRAAIRQVVGEVVDAETVVENDRLIKDKILVYSDGLVESHKVTDERWEDGLVRVTIRATVKRRSLIQKLVSIGVIITPLPSPAPKPGPGEGPAAAAAMVKKAFQGFPGDQLEAKVLDWKPVDEAGGTVTMAVQVEMKPAPEAYRAFQQRLCQRLKDVSLASGEFSTKFEAHEASRDDPCGLPFFGQGNGFHWQMEKLMPEVAFVVKNASRPGKYPMVIAVATLKSGDHTRIEWQYFVLDIETGDAVFAAARRAPACKLVFQDEGGDTVAVDRFNPREDDFETDAGFTRTIPWNKYLLKCWYREAHSRELFEVLEYAPIATPNEVVTRWEADSMRPAIAFVAPVFFGSGWADNLLYVPRIVTTRLVRFTEEEIQPIKKVQCELTFRNVE
jgi:hypothetical protein